MRLRVGMTRYTAVLPILYCTSVYTLGSLGTAGVNHPHDYATQPRGRASGCCQGISYSIVMPCSRWRDCVGPLKRLARSPADIVCRVRKLAWLCQRKIAFTEPTFRRHSFTFCFLQVRRVTLSQPSQNLQTRFLFSCFFLPFFYFLLCRLQTSCYFYRRLKGKLFKKYTHTRNNFDFFFHLVRLRPGNVFRRCFLILFFWRRPRLSLHHRDYMWKLSMSLLLTRLAEGLILSKFLRRRDYEMQVGTFIILAIYSRRYRRGIYTKVRGFTFFVVLFRDDWRILVYIAAKGFWSV